MSKIQSGNTNQTNHSNRTGNNQTGDGTRASTTGKTEKSLALRQMLTTEEAAKILNRKPQTLRKWACLGLTSLRPVRINKRLQWPVDEIIALQRGEC